MRALQKLMRNGTSTVVTIPRPLLLQIGWLPGESIIMELLEDETIRLRRPCERDFMPARVSRNLLGQMPAAPK